MRGAKKSEHGCGAGLGTDVPRASLLDVRGVVVTVAALWCGRGVGQVLCDVVKGGVLASHDPQAKDNAQQVLPSDLRISFNLFEIGRAHV